MNIRSLIASATATGLIATSMLVALPASAQSLFPNSSPASWEGGYGAAGYGGYGYNPTQQVAYCTNMTTNSATSYPQLMQLAACWRLLQQVPWWYWLGSNGTSTGMNGYFTGAF